MKLSHIILAFFLCLSGICIGQSNPGVLTGTIVKNDTFHFSIYSATKPIIINYPESASFKEIGNFVFSSPKKYDAYFIPADDYAGVSTFEVEHYDPNGIPGWAAPFYTTIEINIVESIIYNSCHIVDAGTGIDSVDISVGGFNTSTSGGEISIYDIAHTQNVSSSVIDSITLGVGLNNSNDLGIIQYIVGDTLGTTNLSKVFVRPDGYKAPDSLELFIAPNSSLDIILENQIYTFDNPTNGSLATITSGGYSYTSGSGSYIDTIYFSDGSDSSFVSIKCIDLNTDNDFAKDDYVFTEKNNHVTFDVFANDLKDGYTITSHSPELIHNQDGLFTFYPDPWFIGEKEFFYTVYNGFVHQEASIFIKVDNYLPRTEHNYSFTSFKDDTYLLDYNVPIDDYVFYVETAPTYGSVIIHGTTDTISTTCQTITGPSILEYVPNPGYTGVDFFELEYCTITGSCIIVKVDVEVVDNPNPSYCHCIGSDCVWEGDLNNDGIVNHEDLLPLGFYLGIEGADRVDFPYSVPRGQLADDWNYAFGIEEFDIKHIDANGDGYITASDANAITSNYGQINNLVSDDWIGQSKIGLQFIPRFTTIDSGDLVVIDIAIGTDAYPVSDMQGLSLDLNINSDIVDSASVEVIYHENSWFTYNSPLLDITQQPSDGHIQTAFTRTDPNLALGSGIIATLQFIGEDDLDGFKLLEDTKSIPFAVTARNIKMMSRSGRTLRLQDASVILEMNISNHDPKTSTAANALSVYPNPVQDQLFVKGILEDIANTATIQIMDMSGAVLYTSDLDKISAAGIDVSNLPSGVYLARFEQQGEISVEKFIKF